MAQLQCSVGTGKASDFAQAFGRNERLPVLEIKTGGVADNVEDPGLNKMVVDSANRWEPIESTSEDGVIWSGGFEFCTAVVIHNSASKQGMLVHVDAPAQGKSPMWPGVGFFSSFSDAMLKGIIPHIPVAAQQSVQVMIFGRNPAGRDDKLQAAIFHKGLDLGKSQPLSIADLGIQVQDMRGNHQFRGVVYVPSRDAVVLLPEWDR